MEMEHVDTLQSSAVLNPSKVNNDQMLVSAGECENKTSLSKTHRSFVATQPEPDPKMLAREELERLACRPANTSEERYRVLQAKDQYIRLTTQRTTDIRIARNIEGTCTDMCPEKERYMRDWKCMVPPYERQLTNGTGAQIEHTKAIKQYSRSSADQEVPLPHELRTQQALARTMHFILTNLADLCDSGPEQDAANVSDWFHYIWDRTRGIRKDITQQNLCSPVVVELVQQCTRFHIHCAARLVTEDPSVFDQKINTENMTQCLQTLKYMYTDLAQLGVVCTDEAEFRAYMVLLYLNNGNFLWELRQLPAGIIHSREVQFALAVYFALQENNYVRFFELVRSTTYLNACLLLRYFTQVRQKALDVLQKAYALRATTGFTLEHLTRMLGFEKESEALGFFEHYGVTVERSTGKVLFEGKQSGFYKPKLPYASERALQLVESKRVGPVGETICGAPLQLWVAQFPPAQCVSSFDANGYLRQQLLGEVLGQGMRSPDCSEDEQAGSIQRCEHMHDNTSGTVTSPMSSDDETTIFKMPSPTTAGRRVARKTSSHSPKNHVTNSGTSLQHPEFPVAQTVFINPGCNPFDAPGTTTGRIFGQLCGKPSYQPNEVAVFNDSATTMAYVSPPTNQSITPAGQKRTFFGAAKVGSVADRGMTPAHTPPSSSRMQLAARGAPSCGVVAAPPLFQVNISYPHAMNQPNEQSHQREGNESSLPKKSRGSESMDQRMREFNEHMRKREMERKLKIEIERTVVATLECLLDDVVHERITEFSENRLCNIQYLQEYPPVLLAEVADDLIDEWLHVIAGTVLTEIERHRANRHRRLSKKYWKLWVHRVNVAASWRRLVYSPPIVVSGTSEADDLPPYDQLRLFLDAHYTQHREKNSLNVLEDPAIQREVLLFDSFPECELIDPFAVLFDAMRLIPGTRFSESNPFYWKLTISIPGMHDDNAGSFASFIGRWLHSCTFRRDSSRAVGKHPYFYLEACHASDVDAHKSAAICIRLVRGIVALDESFADAARACDRTNGLLFILGDQTSADRLQQRLRCLLEKTVVPPPVIALLHYQPIAKSAADSGTGCDLSVLGRALDEANVAWKVFRWERASENGPLRAALKFLAEHYRHQLIQDAFGDRLQMCNMHEFVDQCVGIDLWYRLENSCRKRPLGMCQPGSIRQLARDGNAIVRIYNEALLRVQKFTAQQVVESYARFPIDFHKVRVQLEKKKLMAVGHPPLSEAYFPLDWDSPTRFKRLEQFLAGLNLHTLPDGLLTAIDRVGQEALTSSMNLSVVQAKWRSYLSDYPVLHEETVIDNLSKQLTRGVALQLAGSIYTEHTHPLPDGVNGSARTCFWIPLLALISEKILIKTFEASRNYPENELPAEVFIINGDLSRYREDDWWEDPKAQEVVYNGIRKTSAPVSDPPQTPTTTHSSPEATDASHQNAVPPPTGGPWSTMLFDIVNHWSSVTLTPEQTGYTQAYFNETVNKANEGLAILDKMIERKKL